MNTHSKHAALNRARLLYLQHPEGLSDAELAAHLGVSINTANRYRRELGGSKIVAVGKYTMEPTLEDKPLFEVLSKWFTPNT